MDYPCMYHEANPDASLVSLISQEHAVESPRLHGLVGVF